MVCSKNGLCSAIRSPGSRILINEPCHSCQMVAWLLSIVNCQPPSTIKDPSSSMKRQCVRLSSTGQNRTICFFFLGGGRWFKMKIKTFPKAIDLFIYLCSRAWPCRNHEYKQLLEVGLTTSHLSPAIGSNFIVYAEYIIYLFVYLSIASFASNGKPLVNIGRSLRGRWPAGFSRGFGDAGEPPGRWFQGRGGARGRDGPSPC